MQRKIFYLFIFIVLFSSLAGIVVQDELTKSVELAHGEETVIYIRLYNPENKIVQARISQADYLYNAREENWYIEAGKYSRSNANWISVNNNISINPYESVLLPVSIKIPAKTDLRGSYWSALLIENAENFTERDRTLEDGEISVNLRYAVQIVCTIRNTGSLNLDFKNFNISRNDETRQSIVSLELFNSGTLWADVSVKLDLFDNNANFIGTFYSRNQKIYPGLGRNISIPLIPLKASDANSPLMYYAVVVADCGNNQIFGHQFSFSVK